MQPSTLPCISQSYDLKLLPDLRLSMQQVDQTLDLSGDSSQTNVSDEYGGYYSSTMELGQTTSVVSNEIQDASYYAPLAPPTAPLQHSYSDRGRTTVGDQTSFNKNGSTHAFLSKRDLNLISQSSIVLIRLTSMLH